MRLKKNLFAAAVVIGILAITIAGISILTRNETKAEISTCSNCGMAEYDVQPENDNEHVYWCPNCMNAKLEKHNFGSWKTTKAATCTEAGERKKICSVCKFEIKEQIKATGHNFGSWKVTKAATCTEEGISERKCSTCLYTETQKISPSHDYGNTPARYKIAGSASHIPVFKCSKCGTEKNGVVEDHTYGTNGKCTKCGYQPTQPTHTHSYTTLSGYTNVNATSHTPVYSCSCGDKKNGTAEPHILGTDGKCTKCGYQSTQPAHTHSYTTLSGYTNSTETTHTPVYKCSCGATQHGNAEEHTWDAGVCTKCKYHCKHVDNNNDGTCDICKLVIKSDKPDDDECKHNNKKWQCNENEHWQVCNDCGKEIPNTRSNHVYVGGKCKNCGRLENTTVKEKELPNTGRPIIAFAIMGTILPIILGGVNFIKEKQD